jgi:hypothetical protein
MASIVVNALKAAIASGAVDPESALQVVVAVSKAVRDPSTVKTSLVELLAGKDGKLGTADDLLPTATVDALRRFLDIEDSAAAATTGCLGKFICGRNCLPVHAPK